VRLDVNQSQISRYLAQLRTAGLLLDRRQGRWVYYRPNPDLLEWFRDVLRITSEGKAAWLSESTARLSMMNGRPSAPPVAANFAGALRWSPQLLYPYLGHLAAPRLGGKIRFWSDFSRSPPIAGVKQTLSSSSHSLSFA